MNDESLLTEIARLIWYVRTGSVYPLSEWAMEMPKDSVYYRQAKMFLAKIREAVEGINSIDYPYGADFKRAVIKALGGNDMADKEQELKKLLNTSVQKQLEGLAILYWGETYEGKFLATVDFGDLPKFAEYAIKAMGYVKWDRKKVAEVLEQARLFYSFDNLKEDTDYSWKYKVNVLADQLKEILTGGE